MSRCIGICHGPRCGDYGGRALRQQLQSEGYKVEVLACQSLCPHGPIARRGEAVVHRATLETLLESEAE